MDVSTRANELEAVEQALHDNQVHAKKLEDQHWIAVDHLCEAPSLTVGDVVRKLEMAVKLSHNDQPRHEASARLLASALEDLRRLSTG